MPPRFPPIPPQRSPPQQRSAHDEACKLLDLAYGLSGSKFIYIDSSGALIGDFARLVYTPALMIPFIRFAIDLAKMPGFPGIAREVVILLFGTLLFVTVRAVLASESGGNFGSPRTPD